MQNLNRIPETASSNDSKEGFTSLVFYLTEEENTKLENLRKVNGIRNFATTSEFVRFIIKNTYLYLNNKERGIQSDISNLLKEKPYYKDIDKSFIQKLLYGAKEYDLFIEILRLQVLKCYKDPLVNLRETTNDKRISFRLTNEDEKDLKRIFLGNKLLSNPEFIRGYVSYFLNSTRMTQNYILSYPNMLKLERAIKEGRYISIKDEKYKPYKITTSGTVIPRYVLLGFNVDGILTQVPLGYYISSKNIEESLLTFDFNAQEKEIIKAFENLKVIEASFKIENDEDNVVNHNALSNIYEQKVGTVLKLNAYKTEKGKTTISFDYSVGSTMINRLDYAERKGSIKYLCYSDNYYKFLKLNNNKKL